MSWVQVQLMCQGPSSVRGGDRVKGRDMLASGQDLALQGKEPACVHSLKADVKDSDTDNKGDDMLMSCNNITHNPLVSGLPQKVHIWAYMFIS